MATIFLVIALNANLLKKYINTLYTLVDVGIRYQSKHQTTRRQHHCRPLKHKAARVIYPSNKQHSHIESWHRKETIQDCNITQALCPREYSTRQEKGISMSTECLIQKLGAIINFLECYIICNYIINVL